MRLALAFVLAACSSSTKQPEPAGGSTAPPAGSASTAGSTPAAGSAQDSWAPKPHDPAADAALLRADIDMMCGAAKTTGGKTFMDVGPYIAEHMQTDFKVELFADIRTATLDEIIERMRKGMAKVNVKQCETVDVLIANDPRKHHE